MLRDITTRLDDHDPGEKLLHEASAEIKALRSKLGASQKALRSFVDAAKSWPPGVAAIQCDWLCECIPAGEEALK